MDSNLKRCRSCGSMLISPSSPCHTCRALISKQLGKEWMADALCAQVDPELWFPEVGQNVPEVVDKMCLSCPVRRQCLRVGLHESHGVWGGYHPSDRERLRKRLWNATPATRNAVLDKAATYGRLLFLRITPKEN